MRHQDFDWTFARQEDIDSAKRMCDTINGRIAFIPFMDLRTKWMAFKLQDGSSNGDLYDTRKDAVRFNPEYCCYFTFLNTPGGATVRDIWLYMQFHRHAYSRGARMADPDDNNGGKDFLLPVTRSGVASQVSKLIIPGR